MTPEQRISEIKSRQGWQLVEWAAVDTKYLLDALAQSEAARQQAEQERDRLSDNMYIFVEDANRECEARRAAEAKVTALSDAIAQSEAAREKAEQERDYVKNGFDHMAHLCDVWHREAIIAEQKLRSIGSEASDSMHFEKRIEAELRADRAEAKVAALSDTLRVYGKHHGDCPRSWVRGEHDPFPDRPCRCGFTAAQEAILEAKPGQDETGNAVKQEDTHA